MTKPRSKLSDQPIRLNRPGSRKKTRRKNQGRRKDCPACSKRFATHGGLLMHVDKAHPEQRGLLD